MVELRTQKNGKDYLFVKGGTPVKFGKGLSCAVEEDTEVHDGSELIPVLIGDKAHEASVRVTELKPKFDPDCLIWENFFKENRGVSKEEGNDSRDKKIEKLARALSFIITLSALKDIFDDDDNDDDEEDF